MNEKKLLLLIERAAKLGLLKRNVCKLLSINIKTFEKNKVYEKIYTENFADTCIKLTEIAIQQANDGNTTMLIFYLRTHGGWIEGSYNLLGDKFESADYKGKMKILDELVAKGHLSTEDYKKLSKIQLERMGAQEAIEKVEEVRNVAIKLIDRNTELEQEVEKLKRNET